jgi:hypothetical protein
LLPLSVYSKNFDTFLKYTIFLLDKQTRIFNWNEFFSCKSDSLSTT